MKKTAIEFANDDTAPADVVIECANELSTDDQGWALLAPFGDFPSRAVVITPGGEVSRLDAIQRLDRPAAEAMFEHFNSTGQRVRRFFRSVPIFHGHPDVPKLGDSYADKSEKGAVIGLQVRADGLYWRPAFNGAGAALLDGSTKLFPSGRWTSEPAGEENGRPVFRPSRLISVGLTPRPHLPTEMLNDTPSQAPNPEPQMNKTTLLAWLRTCGVELANDATDAQIEAALATVHGRTQRAVELANAAETLATRETELAAARTETAAKATEFSNERAGRITDLLDAQIRRGVLTEAERARWQTRLAADFANERDELLRLEPKLKTASEADGKRKGTQFANAGERREAVLAAVKAKQDAGLSYDDAFARVRTEKPELFAAEERE